MAKNKLNKSDREELSNIIAKIIYKKEKIDKKFEDLYEAQNIFFKNFKEFYYKHFNITDDIEKFGLNYNFNDNLSVSCYKSKANYYNNTCFQIFNPYNSDRYANVYSSDTMRFQPQLIFYSHLSYLNIEIEADNEELISKPLYQYAEEMYKNYVYNACCVLEEASTKAKEAYDNFNGILELCAYDTDVLEYIDTMEIQEYFHKRFNKKLSTELCTLNKDKIDFIKNYLKSVDNQ